MIKLEIKRADGSLYWTEHFETQDDADHWLADEKTRPYWKEEYVSEFTVIDEPKPSIDMPGKLD